MKILITEEQGIRLLTEEVQGLGEFLYTLGEKFPIVDKFHNYLKNDIEKSRCEKIEFCGFTHPSSGASFPNGVLINRLILKENLPKTIFIIFHEIAHQYQYKKYGADFSYKLYNEEMPLKEGIRLLKQTENTADRFGLRKSEEYARLGMYKRPYFPMRGAYDNYTDADFAKYIMTMRKQIQQSGLTSTEEITSMFYNWIKSLD